MQAQTERRHTDASAATAPKTMTALLMATARAIDSVRILALRDGERAGCKQEAADLNHAAAWLIYDCVTCAQKWTQTAPKTNGQEKP